MNALLESFVRAAREHRRDAMLDCFAAADERVSGPEGPIATLAAPTASVMAFRVVIHSSHVLMSNGDVTTTESLTVTFDVEEGGRRDQRTFTFDGREREGDWFFTGAYPGEPALPMGNESDVGANRAAGSVVSIQGDDMAVAIDAGAPLPAAGTPIKLYRRADATDPSGAPVPLVFGVASGEVRRLVGRTAYMRVAKWSERDTVADGAAVVIGWE